VVRCSYEYPLGSILFFSSFASSLTERYPELFEGAEGTSSQHQINFAKKWRAYATIIELANGQLDQIDEVVKEPLEKCLLFLAYRADKNTLEEMLHREAMKRISASK